MQRAWDYPKIAACPDSGCACYALSVCVAGIPNQFFDGFTGGSLYTAFKMLLRDFDTYRFICHNTSPFSRRNKQKGFVVVCRIDD